MVVEQPELFDWLGASRLQNGYPARSRTASSFVFVSQLAHHYRRRVSLVWSSGRAVADLSLKAMPTCCGMSWLCALASKGIDTRTLQTYLGHRSINSTTRYAALAPGRFKNIWGKG
jgi:site-specific recombinase XerD